MSKKSEGLNFKIFPAIDLLGGNIVRLYKGSYENAQVYERDVIELVQQFESEGARYLHIVDLDAARGRGNTESGQGGQAQGRGNARREQNNRRLIAKIARSTTMLLQVGGGIRSSDDIAELQDIGVRRLIFGTVLVQNADLLASWVQRFNVDCIASIDARNGRVRVEGWEADGGMSDEDLAVRAESLGMRSIIYTNISKDGTLAGPDIEGSLRIAGRTRLPVIVSGGMSSHDDFQRVLEASIHLQKSTDSSASVHSNSSGLIEGVIIGKALYEESIQISDCVELMNAYNQSK